MPLRIANLVSSSKEFQSRMDLFVVPFVQMGSSIPEFDLSELLTESQAMTDKVEKLCQKKGGSPEDLPTPSFRAYQWFKFLSERKWMLSHMYALLEFYDLLLELIPSLNKKTLYASIHIEIDHSGYLYRSRKQGRLVYLEINEGFINAPREIKRTILQAALQRRTQSRLKSIRAYSTSPEYQKIHSAMQANHGDNHLAGQGRAYDLPSLFGKINLQYFEGKLDQPRLMWSTRRSMRRLGTYQPDSDTISISKRLDNREVPQILVEYVLYHEMLHKKLGLKEVNGRRYAHTSTFRKLEKQFVGFEEAEKAMKQINAISD